MVQITQVDLPRAFLAASQVRGQQTQNRLGELAMERNQTMNRLAPSAARGDEGAIGEMYGVDPGMAMKMDDRQRKQALDGTRDILAMILVSDTPEKYEAALDQYASEGIDVEKYRGRFPERQLFAKRLYAQLGEMGGGDKPLSPLGKLTADERNKFVDPENAAAMRKKMTTTGPGVTVNVGPTGIDYGDPPTGMAWARDEGGKVALEKDPNSKFLRPVAVPIAGGPVETKRTKAEEAAEVKRRLELAKVDLVVEDIDRAISMTKSAKIPVTGFGSFLAAVPGTRAHDVSALVTTIKANIGFDRLQQMRESSPTGGALGAVSEREMDQLSSVLGNLEQSQTEEMFLFNLNRVREMVLDIVHGPGNRPGKDAKAAQGSAAGQPEETKTVGSKTYHKLDGKWYEQ